MQIEKTHDFNSIDVRSLLLEMRKCRMGLIQTADQLRFSYLAIIEGGHGILSNGNATLDILSDYMDVSIHFKFENFYWMRIYVVLNAWIWSS